MVVEQKKKKTQTNMTMMMDKISVNDDYEEDDERKNKWSTKKNQFDVMKFENKHETIWIEEISGPWSSFFFLKKI